MQRMICSSILTLIFTGSVHAGEPANEKTLVTWKSYEKAKDEFTATLKGPLAAYRAAKTPEDREKALNKYREVSTKGQVFVTKVTLPP